MAVVSTCPGAAQWQRLLLGELPEHEADVLEQHLTECPVCLQTVRGVPPAGDTLAEVLRSRPTLTEQDVPEVVRQLIQHLKGLRTESGDGAALDGIETRASETVAPPSGEPDGEKAAETYDFLAAAQGPGEIGRLGPYRVVNVLGAGGMGVVFLAEDPGLQRTVALKALKPTLAVSDSARKRFLREARATAALDHDHVVQIYQVGEDRGIPFLAMQLLKGETLEARVRRDGRLPPAEVLRIGREAAAGLAAAHQRGLIHRDVKPSNIWLEGEARRVKILDFGLVHAEADDTHLTETGAVAGTPAYMAPEQAQGDKVDARSDLFSLGCVLYCLCTGAAPFQAANKLATLLALTHHQPKPPRALNPDTPQALSDLIMRLLAREPAGRPESAGAVVEAITDVERAQTCPPAPACAAAVPAEQPKRSRRRRVFVAVAAAVLLLAAGAVLVPQIVIRIFDKDGNEVAKQEVGKGGKVVVEQPGKPPIQIPGNGGGPKVEPKQKPPPAAGPLDRLDPAQIPAAERFPWHPMELVAVLGTHDRRHFTRLQDVAWSPDGKWIACGGEDLGISLFDAATLTRRAWLPGAGFVLRLAFSPDSRSLACSAEGADTLQLWDLTEGELKRPRAAVRPGTRVSALAFAPDGKTLASGGEDGTVRLWHLAGAELRAGAVIKAHEKGSSVEFGVPSVAFAADGKTLVSLGSLDGLVRLWDVGGAEPKERAVIKVGPRRNTVALPPDGKTPTVPAIRSDNPSRRNAFALAPDGKTLAVTDNVTTLRLWDLSGAEPTERPVEAAQVGTGGAFSLAFSPDSQTVVVGCANGLALWDLSAEPKRRAWVDGHLPRVALSPDGRKLVTATGQDCTLRLWDLTAVEPRELAPLERHHSGLITALGFAPAEQTLVSASRDRTVRSWDVGGAQPREQATVHLPAGGQPLVAVPARGQPLAAVYSYTNQPGLWDLAWKEPRSWARLVGQPLNAVFSADGNTLAFADLKAVRVWDLRVAKPREQVLPHPTADIRPLALSADGRLLATAQTDSVQLWDLSGPKPQRHVLPANAAVSAVAFSPDARTLVIGTAPGRLQFWGVGEMKPKELASVPGGPGWRALNFSPDGKVLAGCGAGFVAVWDTASWRELRRWQLGIANQVAFLDDGRHLALGNFNGTIYILRLNPLAAAK